jgi:hypothetical protein
VPVDVSCDTAAGAWSERNRVAITFTARKSDGEHQALHLSQREVEASAAMTLRLVSEKTRERLLLSLLRDLSDAKLLRTLAVDLRRRVRLPKRR